MSDEQIETLVMDGGEIKSLGNGKVGGYLVRFTTPSDPDLEGDYFTKDTDFDMEFPGKSTVYFQHAMDAKFQKRTLGKADLSMDEFGIWAETILAERDDYEKFLLKLRDAGKLGWSSGTAAHLVEVERSGKATFIKRWPLGLDASLTHTPAESRNSVSRIKSLLPEIESPQPPFCPTGKGDINEQGEIKMTDEVKEEVKAEEPVVDVKAIVDAAVKSAIEAQTVVNAGGILAPNIKRVTEMGFKDDAKKGFMRWMATGDEAAVKGAWQGQTDNEGGYTVPDDFFATIVEKRDLQSFIRQAPVLKIQTSRDRVLIPVESTAGTKMVVTAEEAGYDENEPVFGQVALNIHKFTKLIKVSEELLSDTGANLEQYMANTFARAAAKAENYYGTVGTGTGMPLGVISGGTQGIATTANATAITAAEILSLKAALGSTYHDPSACGWLMRWSTLHYVRAIAGNPFQFAPTPQGDDGNMLLGYPVYLSDDMDALAGTSAKATLIGNWNYLAFAEKPGMTVRRNEFLYMANGAVGFFASVRFGIATLQAEAFQYMTQKSS